MWWRVLFVTTIGGLIAACQQGPNQSRSGPAPTAALAPPPRLLTGSFTAISTTAMGITGDLTLTATTLTFTRGLVFETTPAANLPASGLYAKNAGTWTSLLGAQNGGAIEVRAVVSERVGAQATNGGLCAPEKTTFIALTSTTDAANASALRMAAFKTAVAPGANANESDLCGTFTYAPR